MFKLYLFGFLVCYWWIGVLIHELGHVVSWWFETKKIPALRFKRGALEVGDNQTWFWLDKYQKARILFLGVMSGFVFYASLGLLGAEFEWVAIMFISYSLWTSRRDIKSLIQLSKEMKA